MLWYPHHNNYRSLTNMMVSVGHHTWLNDGIFHGYVSQNQMVSITITRCRPSPAPGPDPWRRGGGTSRHPRHGAVVFGGGSTGHTGAALAAGDRAGDRAEDLSNPMWFPWDFQMFHGISSSTENGIYPGCSSHHITGKSIENDHRTS